MCVFLLSLSATGGELVSGVVVSVHRPLEMESRRVEVPRQIFIANSGEASFSERVIGQTLDVYRIDGIPYQLMQNSDAVIDSMVSETVYSKYQVSSPGDATLPLSNGRPAGFAKPRHQLPHSAPVFIGGADGNKDESSTPEPAETSPRLIRRHVGRIRVVKVDGGIAIAEIVEDGLRADEKSQPRVKSVETVTVSAGDLVEGVLATKKKKVNPIPLSPAEKQALKQARKRLKNKYKPRKKPQKFRRAKMLYDH